MDVYRGEREQREGKFRSGMYIKRFNFNTHCIAAVGWLGDREYKNYIHRDDSIRLSTIISGVCDWEWVIGT